MTDKTPIEKAAEEISDLSYELMKIANLPMNAKEIANIIRRVLIEETPKKDRGAHISDSEMTRYVKGYNQCRRDIGLRDDTEETT